ncbi:uncharacterized protein LMH87_008771 [Akanthomyces muscarius]|uniref:Uncharacterized protein n=1 Tax=Akanthomyces muscarius TaxID=2231603 RepID=A0A9W8QIP9_AKAMU|nr:uncharacterized protein LMH87_008771 [Akanthomyces muscarius]KAJ4158238.1 hypothetical protein LMH87_008771 [Akanthomyces muscarius]
MAEKLWLRKVQAGCGVQVVVSVRRRRESVTLCNAAEEKYSIGRFSAGRHTMSIGGGRGRKANAELDVRWELGIAQDAAGLDLAARVWCDAV